MPVTLGVVVVGPVAEMASLLERELSALPLFPYPENCCPAIVYLVVYYHFQIYLTFCANENCPKNCAILCQYLFSASRGHERQSPWG